MWYNILILLLFADDKLWAPNGSVVNV